MKAELVNCKRVHVSSWKPQLRPLRKLPERWADPASEPSCLAITLVVGGDGRVASEPRIDPLYEKAGSGCR